MLIPSVGRGGVKLPTSPGSFSKVTLIYQSFNAYQLWYLTLVRSYTFDTLDQSLSGWPKAILTVVLSVVDSKFVNFKLPAQTCFMTHSMLCLF